MVKGKAYVEALQPLMQARQERLRRVQPLPVIDHARFGGPTATGFGTPGSLILFLCRTRDDMSNALRTLAGGETAM